MPADLSTGVNSAGSANTRDEHDPISQDADENMSEHNSESSSPRLSPTIQEGQDHGTSVVQYLGPSSSYCGYCKRSERQSGGGRRSYDMQTYKLRVSDYQTLLDRNWRRSGTYGYCPINETTCCPNYPVICKATKFQLTRSQRKCIAKVNSYLATGDVTQTINLDYSRDPTCEKESIPNRRIKSLDEIRSSSKLRAKRFLRSCERKARIYGKTQHDAMMEIREKWDNKLQPKQPLESYLFPRKATLTDVVEDRPFRPKHQLKIDMVHVNSQRCRASREEQHHMLQRYQKKVHKEIFREWTMSKFCDFLVESPLITEPLTNFDYVADNSNNEAGNDTFTMDLHSKDDEEFILLKPPHLPTAFGTYHCNYYLDDKLIATGVLDVLPKCITTVYFFYDTEYDFLNLGIYSALIEISMVRQMSNHYIIGNANSENQLVNYYLGFYVHECKKMHYKTRFRPSYLLCSKTYCYVPTETCLEKLSNTKYADFASEQQEECSRPSLINLISIPIVPPVVGLSPSMMAYITWLESNLGHEYPELLLNGYLVTYAKLVGQSLLPRLTLRVNVVHRTLLERHKRLTKAGEPTKKHTSTA